MKKSISDRQAQILGFIEDQVERRGFPPSVREIGSAVGLQSSSTVHAHLRRLEKLGYIRRDPTKPRAIEILKEGGAPKKPIIHVPVVGQVTAGMPILCVENIEDSFPLPADFCDQEDLYILRIKGDSMIEAGILDKDQVIVHKQEMAKNGDIVVALVNGDEATVKRFYHKGDHIVLQPDNAAMEPIIVNDVRILGKVIGLIRRIH